METNPKEIELNFDSSSGQDLEELEKAREALSEEINFNAAPENEVEDFAEEYSDSEDLPLEADPEVEEKAFEPEQSVSNVVNNDTEMLLRSRHPVNRPAGDFRVRRPGRGQPCRRRVAAFGSPHSPR